MTEQAKTESKTDTNLFSQWSGQSARRLQAAVDQWESWEEKNAARTEEAVQEMAHLIRSTMDYGLTLQAEMRRQAIDNSRKMLSMVAGEEG